MIEKEIILLTKSSMINHFCTAGIDSKTGEWIRIVSPDESTQHAVTETDMTFSNGKVAEVLDVVRIKCLDYKPTFCQPENYLLDRRYKWEFLRKTSIRNVLSIHEAEVNKYIFYNTSYKVSDNDLKTIGSKDMHSLTLIEPSALTVVKEQNPWKHKLQYYADFSYSGNWYNFMRIKDPAFENEFERKPLGPICNLPKSLFVVSLANTPVVEHGENMHYKLVAAILPQAL